MVHQIPPPTEPLTDDEYRWYTALWNAVEPPRGVTIRQLLTASLKIGFGVWLLVNPPGFMVEIAGGFLPTAVVGIITALGGVLALVGAAAGRPAVEEVGLRLAQIGLLLTLAITSVVLWDGMYGRAALGVMALLVAMAVLDADKRIALLKWRPVRTLIEE